MRAVAQLEVGSDRRGHLVIIVDEMNDAPFVEGQAGMGDSKRDHVPHRKRRVLRDRHMAMLVVQPENFVSMWYRKRLIHRAAGAKPRQGDGRIIVGRIALPKPEDGLGRLRPGLDIGPDLQGWLKAAALGRNVWIALAQRIERPYIHQGIVRDVAAGAQENDAWSGQLRRLQLRDDEIVEGRSAGAQDDRFVGKKPLARTYLCKADQIVEEGVHERRGLLRRIASQQSFEALDAADSDLVQPPPKRWLLDR